jgi:hypothetical protein
MKRSFLVRASILALSLAAVASLSGCGRGSDTASTAGIPSPVAPSTVDATTAPALAALPPAPPARLARVSNPSDSYAPVEQAYYMSEAEDGPPDYAFDYDGVQPLAWQAQDDSTLFAEPVDGGYRDYYYSPGSAYPYLVRDPSYAYGYQDGQLVAVYDRSGRQLSRDQVARRADDAGRYLARAQALYRASRTPDHRQAVTTQTWSARRAQVSAQRMAWAVQQNRQPDWRAYHDAHQVEEQTHWQAEPARRQVAAVATPANVPRQGDLQAHDRAEAQARQAQASQQAQLAAQAQQADAARGAQADAAQRAQAGQARQQAQAMQRAQAEQARTGQRAQAEAARQQGRTAEAAERTQAEAGRQQAQAAQAAQRAQAGAARQQAQAAQAAQRAQAGAARQQAQAAQAQARAVQKAQGEQARQADRKKDQPPT